MGIPSLNYQTAEVKMRKLFYGGTDAISQGTGVCYDQGYTSSDTGEAAADACQKRLARVKKPDETNNLAFAGVVAANYAANPLGQYIDVILPGSGCVVQTDRAVTIGFGNIITCIARGSDAGKFGPTGFWGRGSARVLQTLSGAGLALVELLDGPESGLVEVITPAAAGGATQLMVGGVSYLAGTVTLAADATSTLANGTYDGQRKAIKCIGTYSTSQFDVTITSGLKVDVSTALTHLSFNANNESALLEWRAGAWVLLNATTAAQAAEA